MGEGEKTYRAVAVCYESGTHGFNGGDEETYSSYYENPGLSRNNNSAANWEDLLEAWGIK